MRLVHTSSLLLLVLACDSNRNEPALSQRERDSLIGASRLPGAAGVRGALRAADSAAARSAHYDSAGQR
jgi:hypothetical protein